MPKLGPSPFVWLPFDAEGGTRRDWPGQDAKAELQAAIAAPGITDLVVISHGWQNDRPVAEALYDTLWGNVCAALAGKGVAPAHIVVAGVLWPAKKYDADYDGARALDVQRVVGATLGLDDSGAVSLTRTALHTMHVGL